jgi:hypothetical protein
MVTKRLACSIVLIFVLLAPGASVSLAQPVAPPAAAAFPPSSNSMLIVENAGQWPAVARFQVWGGVRYVNLYPGVDAAGFLPFAGTYPGLPSYGWVEIGLWPERPVCFYLPTIMRT